MIQMCDVLRGVMFGDQQYVVIFYLISLFAGKKVNTFCYEGSYLNVNNLGLYSMLWFAVADCHVHQSQAIPEVRTCTLPLTKNSAKFETLLSEQIAAVDQMFFVAMTPNAKLSVLYR